MNQNQCLQYTANQVHASYQIPAVTTQRQLPNSKQKDFDWNALIYTII